MYKWCTVKLDFYHIIWFDSRKQCVGHGNVYKEVRLTSQSRLGFLGAALLGWLWCFQRKEVENIIERSWLLYPEVRRDEEDTWQSLAFLWKIQRHNNGFSCFWWLNDEKATEDKLHSQRWWHKGVWSCWPLVNLVERSQDLSPLKKNCGQESRLDSQSYPDRDSNMSRLLKVRCWQGEL